MRRVKVLVFVFSLLMFMPKIVNAQCDYNDKSKLQALANNVNITYNYQETNDGINSGVKFNITITNLNPDIYIVDQTNIGVYYYNNTNEITLGNYMPGTTTRFIVYGNTPQCKGVELMNHYITLPSYNRFYKDSVCDGLTSYKLCQRWSRVEMSYDQFVKQVQDYKASLMVPDVPGNEIEPTLVDKIIEFLLKYSFYLFGGIIVVCSCLIVYLKHKNDFDLS